MITTAIAFALSAGIALAACTSARESAADPAARAGHDRAPYPIEHRLSAEPHTTTVDSALARDYLNGTVSPELMTILREFDARPLSSASLTRLSARTSPDFATAYFLKRQLAGRAQRHRQLQFTRAVQELRDADRAQLMAPAMARKLRSNFVFLFVPGLFYQSKPESKSDMRTQREQLNQLGYRTELIAVPEMGTVEGNAAIVADALRRRRHQQVILVSASKGGPDIGHALGQLLRPDETRHVRAWVNVGGAMGGSPLADRLIESPEMVFARAYAWFKGGDACALAVSLSQRRSRERLVAERIPAHVFVLNYMAVPFSGDITPDVRGAYGYMRRFGPNDGVVQLLDQQAHTETSGETIYAVGSDHRFLAPEIAVKTLALLRLDAERVLSPKASAHRPK